MTTTTLRHQLGATEVTDTHQQMFSALILAASGKRVAFIVPNAIGARHVRDQFLLAAQTSGLDFVAQSLGFGLRFPKNDGQLIVRTKSRTDELRGLRFDHVFVPSL